MNNYSLENCPWALASLSLSLFFTLSLFLSFSFCFSISLSLSLSLSLFLLFPFPKILTSASSSTLLPPRPESAFSLCLPKPCCSLGWSTRPETARVSSAKAILFSSFASAVQQSARWRQGSTQHFVDALGKDPRVQRGRVIPNSSLQAVARPDGRALLPRGPKRLASSAPRSRARPETARPQHDTFSPADPPPPRRTGTLVYLVLPRGPKWHARCSRPDTACPLSFALLRAARNGTLAARGLARWTLFISYMFVFMLLGYFDANTCRRQSENLQKRNGEKSPQHLQITKPSETCTTTGHLLQWDY